VCRYVRIYACMYVCMYVCMYACMHNCMYVCIHVCMYVSIPCPSYMHRRSPSKASTLVLVKQRCHRAGGIVGLPTKSISKASTFVLGIPYLRDKRAGCIVGLPIKSTSKASTLVLVKQVPYLRYKRAGCIVGLPMKTVQHVPEPPRHPFWSLGLVSMHQGLDSVTEQLLQLLRCSCCRCS